MYSPEQIKEATLSVFSPLDGTYVDTLCQVLDLVRSRPGVTRPELTRLSGLGRNVVSQRAQQLTDAGLIEEGPLGRSTGGRAPRELRFRAESGHVLAAELGATGIGIALADLAGRIVDQVHVANDVARGPEPSLELVDQHFRRLRDRHSHLPLWAAGVCLPGPVEWRTGRPVAPPIMPGWDGFDVRGFFAKRHGVPVWVDNDVNAMAVGELRAGIARDEADFLYVKVGTGIGAGLVSGGRLHRGAQGAAGDIGHVAVGTETDVLCRCGQAGCLEALAGGAALARDARRAAADPRSGWLARRAGQVTRLTSADVITASLHGDAAASELLRTSATLVGQSLARMVNFFNPSLIVLGGEVGRSSDLYLATVRQVVLDRSLPLATRSLSIDVSPLGNEAGVRGAAFLAIDELLSREALAQWITDASPVGLQQASV